MVFSSLVFIFAFLPFTIVLYYLSPRHLKNFTLFAASLVFYAWGEPVYIIIMIFSTFFDYTNGILIEKYRGHKGAARAVLITSIVVNSGLLCFFKYSGFILNNINGVLGLNLPALSLPLPVGISFYTFQTMSYVIDLYLDKVPVQRSIISFGTYVTMFPQLIAGPIVKYGDIAKQLYSRRESLDMFGEGVETFVAGLAKKVLIANNIGMLWDSVKLTPFGELSVLSAWLGILGFTFQIYFDFSGYSDMAIGLGKMFGFRLTKNFDYPYTSKSVTEFWRRWHISLGSWFREYVYIPLGGNRNGKLKQYRNLFIVWFLTGLWHGANWNFIFWGLYFGFFITIEKIFLARWLKNKRPILGWTYTFLVAVVGWVFFEFENLGQGMGFLRVMFGFSGVKFVDSQGLYYLYTNALIFIAAALFSTPYIRNALEKVKLKLRLPYCAALSAAYLLLMLLSTAYLVNESYNPFLYFRF